MSDEDIVYAAHYAASAGSSRSVPARAPSRTAAILDAVRKLLEGRNDLIDQADDLGSFSIIVNLYAGTTIVKSVVCSEERIHRRLR